MQADAVAGRIAAQIMTGWGSSQDLGIWSFEISMYLAQCPSRRTQVTYPEPPPCPVQCGASSRHRQPAHRPLQRARRRTPKPKNDLRTSWACAPCQLNKIRRSACGWRGLGPRPTCFCFWPGASHTRRRRFWIRPGRAPHLMIALKLRETTPPHVPPPCEHQAKTRRKEPRIVKSEE